MKRLIGVLMAVLLGIGAARLRIGEPDGGKWRDARDGDGGSEYEYGDGRSGRKRRPVADGDTGIWK